ncbi:MAG: dipeptide ABC transporter ATP-binding protein [Eubacteriales bacterium]|nr:dipeptide ABC transporter ATP-binding protein [Eubacteriales bacterium]
MEQKERKAVIKAENVCKYFPVKGGIGKASGQVKAVDGVSLELYAGETYGMVGESGCGKSTLGRTLIRLLDPTSGRILLDGTDIASISKKDMRAMRQKVQMVFQDPYTSLNPRKRVGDILMEALEIHQIGTKQERMASAMQILGKVGLRPEHFYRYPHEFSGGQRQRVGLARALILNPQIIICDEPVSALDVSIQSQIINLLQELQKEGNLSYLFIAHDMSVVKYISDRIGVMYLGHLVEEAETDELFDHTLHPYTQALLSAVPDTNPHVKKERIILEGDLPSPLNPPSGCVFHTRCPKACEKCSKKTPKMQELRPGHRVACLLYED